MGFFLFLGGFAGGVLFMLLLLKVVLDAINLIDEPDNTDVI